MSIIEFFSQPLWHRIGLTLLHFLWQGLIAAVLVGVLVRVFRLKHGNKRYTAYVLAFIVMIACPVVTFTVLDINQNIELAAGSEFTGAVANSSNAALPAIDVLPDTEIPSEVMPALDNSIPLTQRISNWLYISMPWVLVIWMLGVIVLSVRLVMGFIGVYRWQQVIEPLPERLNQRIAFLSERLGMKNFSRVFISPTVLQAMAVGYLRPMVLLPAAMLTQMHPEMIEAVIAHELAHIRRFDLWVNLIQRVTETLLFYHPAIWWLSNRIRSERELCCDEMAVEITGERLTYASTLASVSKVRFTAKQPVLAAGLGQDKKPTLSRVRHILGLRPTQRNSPFWLAGVIAVMFLAAIAIPTALAFTNQSDEKLNDLDTPDRAERKIKRFLEKHPKAEKISFEKNQAVQIEKEYRIRKFVRLVVGKNKITFQGKEIITWDQLSNLLNQVDHRNITVFEVGFTEFPERGTDIPLSKWLNKQAAWQKAALFCKEYGFEYLSFIGKHKLGTVSGGTRNYLVRPMEFSKEIKINLPSAEDKPLVDLSTIEFSKDKAVLRAKIISSPKTKWDIEIAFFDENMKRLDYIFVNYENSGIAIGTAVNYKEIIEVDISKIKNLEKTKFFELSIKQAENRDKQKQKQKSKNKSIIDIKPGDLKLKVNAKRGVCNLVVSIKNENSVAIPEFKLRYYRGPVAKNRNEAGNPHSGWHNAGPIEPGKQWNEGTRDFYLPDGEYEFSVVLDYDNTITEADEDNNTASIKVVIRDSKIDQRTPQILTDIYILSVPSDLPQLQEIISNGKSKTKMITPKKIEEFLEVIRNTPQAKFITASKILTNDNAVGTMGVEGFFKFNIKNHVHPDRKTITMEFDFEYLVSKGQDVSSSSMATKATVLSGHSIAIAGNIPLNGKTLLLLVKPQIAGRQCNLKVLDVEVEPVAQGKNVLYTTVKNTSDTEQLFATHIYTRSVDYGPQGVGWGTVFFEKIQPSETKRVRFAYKIPGPVTENSYMRVKFYNPKSENKYDYDSPFAVRRTV